MSKIIISSFDDIDNPHYGGGGARAIHKLAKKLAQKHEVVVVSGDYAKSQVKIDGIEYLHIGPKFVGPRLRMLIFNFLLPLRAQFLKYDLWIESFTPPVSSAFMPLFTRKPVVGVCHMLAAADMQRKYKLPFLRQIESFALKFYKDVICISQSDAAYIQSLNKKAKIEVIPNGINLARGTAKNRKRVTKYILFIGRIEINQKGLDLLLKAYSQIESQVNFKLMIIGSGVSTEIDKLKKLVVKYKLKNKVELAGFVDGKKKYRFMEEALFVVVPSRFETFSVVTLEAFSRGKTVVCFKLDNLSWAKKGSVQVEKMSSNELAKAILELSQDSKLLKYKEKQAFGVAKNYSWSNILSRYEASVDRVLDTHKRSY